MVAQTFKSIFHGLLSIFVLYFLGGVIPKFINVLSTGVVRVYLIACYWIAFLTVLIFPQYIVWFLDEETDIICSLKSYGWFCASILAVSIVSLIGDKLAVNITLSTTSTLIYTISFWLFAFLVIYVPQVYVYEPLRERYM